MSKFLITYKNGNAEEVITDAETVADQINRTFGLSEKEAEEFGVKVELIKEDEQLADESRRETQQDLEAEVEVKGGDIALEGKAVDSDKLDTDKAAFDGAFDAEAQREADEQAAEQAGATQDAGQGSAEGEAQGDVQEPQAAAPEAAAAPAPAPKSAARKTSAKKTK